MRLEKARFLFTPSWTDDSNAILRRRGGPARFQGGKPATEISTRNGQFIVRTGCIGERINEAVKTFGQDCKPPNDQDAPARFLSMRLAYRQRDLFKPWRRDDVPAR